MNCEERASVEGEASLAIALSKPLMRLGKLPLLMQSVSRLLALSGEFSLNLLS